MEPPMRAVLNYCLKAIPQTKSAEPSESASASQVSRCSIIFVEACSEEQNLERSGD